ncbi:MAG: hypothetical protein H7Y37_04595 [Anaerolineae bacterium]|nr:hypothetical protein [Gloeobacterales cyanobacterium ES-bin-313]
MTLEYKLSTFCNYLHSSRQSAFDIETGDYDLLSGAMRLQAKHPDAAIYGKRIGYNAVVAVGGTLTRIVPFLCGSCMILSVCTVLVIELTAIPALAQETGGKASNTPLAIDMNHLFQHWVRSTEEEKPEGTVQIFRPAASMTFPPSRFRMTYKFARNGSCELYSLSPDDAHQFKTGKWRIDGKDKTLLRITTDGKTISFRIVELSKTLMRIAPST